jgi:hypothetical protein
MARSAAEARTEEHDQTMDEHVRIEEDCLELNPVNDQETQVLRTWIRRVNGATYPQPFLVESPPGHFRLYVGEAAERVRTQRGIQ